MSFRILPVLIALVVASPASAAEFDIGPGYTKQTIEGFTCLVHDDVMKQGRDRFQRLPLDVLAKEFEDMRRVLKPAIYKILQDVPVWVEWDKGVGATVAVYYGGTAHALAREGRNPRMANCVQLLTMRRLCELRPPGSKFQQIILLHEMAHAIHHRLLGWDDGDVKSTFKQAVDRKMYENVTDRFGNRVKQAYARTNEAEYFAEITCAYLDTCHYYPFNHRDLKGYDPEGFALMEKVYQSPEKYVGRISKVEIGQPSKSMSAKAPPGTSTPVVNADPTVERDSMLKLDQIKSKVREGKNAEAKEELEKLIRKYPNTQAAQEAQTLLGTIK